MSINRERILKRAKPAAKKQYSIYLSIEVFEKFKAFCTSHDLKVNGVIEQLIKEFAKPEQPAVSKAPPARKGKKN